MNSFFFGKLQLYVIMLLFLFFLLSFMFDSLFYFYKNGMLIGVVFMIILNSESEEYVLFFRVFSLIELLSDRFFEVEFLL